MKPSSDHATDLGSLTPDAALALVEVLAEEMIERWRQGEHILPEAYLDRFPGLREHPEAAAELIYEEVNLRSEYGLDVPTEHVLERFAQWRPQLEVLFDCHRILSHRPAPRFPRAGEVIDDFRLLAKLGSGRLGRVFLASQMSLADRHVVLKFTPWDALEYLTLARLQHPHIVPLYSVHNHPDCGLRSLCMPYHGGAVLSRLFALMRPTPPAKRTAQTVLDALDRAQAQARPAGPPDRIVQPASARGSYVQAVCWIGACLADALHYAHERNLVHLDIKPSNVLMAANGQPMLLDFHLAGEPFGPGRQRPYVFGGTPGYMSPEHRDALQAIRESRPIERPVDARSDVYSLGVALYEALTGELPAKGDDLKSVRRHNASVTTSLDDCITACLADDPARRHRDASALSALLRQHAGDCVLGTH